MNQLFEMPYLEDMTAPELRRMVRIYHEALAKERATTLALAGLNDTLTEIATEALDARDEAAQ